MKKKGTFEYDLNYLQTKDSTLILLKDSSERGQIIVSPKFQGKVFTSTCQGLKGQSLGWVNYEAFEAKTLDEHFNAYGGEDRMWIGPEGGLFSVFIKPNEEQIFANWHTPLALDRETWTVENITSNNVVLFKTMQVENYLGNVLKMKLNRKITILNKQAINETLGLQLPKEIFAMAYETENEITNLNDFEWTKDTGTICIWMLDMSPVSQVSSTIIPFKRKENDSDTDIVKSDYFGSVPNDRLKIYDNVLLFKTDGKYRSKLGLNVDHAKGLAGNYDESAHRLTVISFDVCNEAPYLNQSWDATQDPLVGSVLNAYNDGPLEDGSQMGPFLELESTSPGAFLKPNEKIAHHHCVYHFVGEENELNIIVEKLFETDIKEIKRFNALS